MPRYSSRFIILLIALAILSACGPAGEATPPAMDEAAAPVTPIVTALPSASSFNLETPVPGSFDPGSVQDIDLTAYPIMPAVTDHAIALYRAGLADHHNPRVFSKIGDCMTAASAFLTPFGADNFDLGDYGELQAVLDYFGGIPARGEGFTLDSFANPGLATASGFNAASVLDPTWIDPNWCQPNESPLACEYRVSRPGLAIIMFGTNDVFYLEAADFDYYLRNVVLKTIQSGVVPVLSTFPGRPEYPEKSILFNQIIVRIAENYDLPLINLWLALQKLPNQGVDTTETIHLTVPGDGNTGILDDEHLQAGYTYRNLITLQALDVLRQGLGMIAG